MISAIHTGSSEMTEMDDDPSSVAVSVVVVPSMGMEFLELGWARRLPSADLRLPADAPEPAAEAEEEPVVDKLEEVMEEE